MFFASLRNLHFNVKIRLFEFFLTSMFGCMLYPFMIVYFAEHFGEAVAGFMMAFNVGAGILAQLYGGHFSDMHGRRKVLIITSIIAFVLHLLMTIFNSNYFIFPTCTFVLFFFISIVNGFSFPAASAMIIDCTTLDERKFVYGLQYWLFNAAFLVGNLVGGFMFLHYKTLLMSLITFGDIISIFIMVFCIQELYKPDGKPRKMIKNYWKIIQDKKFMLFCVGSSLLMSLESFSNNYMLIKLTKQEEISVFGFVSTEMYSLFMSENTLLVVTLGLFFTAFVRKSKNNKLFWASGIIYSIAIGMYTYFCSPLLLFISMFIITINELVIVPSKQAIVADMVPDSDRSSYMAMNTVVNRSFLLLSYFAVTIGYYASNTLFSFMLVCTGMFSVLLMRHALKNHTVQVT